MALSPGGRTEAAEFHARLASSALGHEWFLGNDVDETIRSVLSANGPPEDIAKMLKPRMTHFHLFLSKEERAQLDAAAAEQGLSRADVLRQSFRNYPKPKET